MATRGKTDDAKGSSANLGFEAKLWRADLDLGLRTEYKMSRRPAGPLSQDMPNFGGFFFALGVRD